MQTLEPPQYVYWYHNDKIINYDTKRTRVSFDMGKVGTALGGCRCRCAVQARTAARRAAGW